MDRLSSDASGLRHLRWGREALAGVEAFLQFNPRLSTEDKEALSREAAALGGLVAKLSAAVKPYRDFLERTRVHFRARRRLADFLCRAPDPAAEAFAEAQEAAFIRMEEEQRRPLKAAVRSAVADLREGLVQMNTRLVARFGEALVEAFYPNVTADATRVLDDNDNDDDAAAEA